MKHINDILNESLLDDEDEIMARGEKRGKLMRIWADLAENWGEVLLGSARGAVTIDNIDLDSKGRITFKNWPGNTINLYFGSIGFVPDSIKECGFGDLPSNVNIIRVQQFRGKLSDLNFEGNYKNCHLELEQGSYELDKFPKFSIILFNDCNFKNVHLMPKRQPKGTKIKFDSSSQTNLFGCWSYWFFKGNYAQWAHNGMQEIIT